MKIANQKNDLQFKLKVRMQCSRDKYDENVIAFLVLANQVMIPY